jgi:hypothetical protein
MRAQERLTEILIVRTRAGLFDRLAVAP